MATRYGHEIAARLVERHGWAWAPIDEERYGDRHVIDPVTGKSHTPYQAKEIQLARDSQAMLEKGS